MIVAVLIVKNESHVIERCLRSVLPHVDAVFIYDTGSELNEVTAMRAVCVTLRREFGKGIARDGGEWKGFADSRNDALEAAALRFDLGSLSDWLFMIDADDYVTAWEEPPPGTPHAGFSVTMQSGSVSYPRTQLFRPGLWHYRGVVHEFPECQGPMTVAGSPGATVGTLATIVTSTREGDRNRDPDKYRKDAALLIEAILVRNDPDLIPRYKFYLAQSWRDAGEDVMASATYMERAAMTEGYAEERYVSLLENMRLKQIHEPWEDYGISMREQLLMAQEICPHRRECVVAAMRWLTDIGAWTDILDLDDMFPAIEKEPNGLFIEAGAYGHHQHDIVGVAAYYAGQYKRSLIASLTALQLLPNASLDTKRLARNIEWAASK